MLRCLACDLIAPPGEKRERIDGLAVFSYFKMKMRSRGVSCIAHCTDLLPLPDRLITLYIPALQVGISRFQVTVVPKNDQVSVGTHHPGIHRYTRRDGEHSFTGRCCEIDPLMPPALAARFPERRRDPGLVVPQRPDQVCFSVILRHISGIAGCRRRLEHLYAPGGTGAPGSGEQQHQHKSRQEPVQAQKRSPKTGETLGFMA